MILPQNGVVSHTSRTDVRFRPTQAYHRRGIAYRDLSDLDLARADWERVIELYEERGLTEEAEEGRALLAELED